MSLALDASHIVCDGDNCEATVRVPVALRSLLSPRDNRPSAAGWLCITTTNRTGHDHARHFCPVCAVCYLSDLLGARYDPAGAIEPRLASPRPASAHHK